MSGFLFSDKPVFTGEAPGRMDVMGGISDYSGSLLLQMPIAEKTTVKIQPRQDRRFHIVTVTADTERKFEYEWRIEPELSLPEAGKQLRSFSKAEWPLYILGCFVLLQKKKQIKITGADVSVTTSIPLGKGVSSSAAIEVATLRAIAEAWQLKIEPIELPLYAQAVENEIVGAACGLMDQLSVCFGLENHLLPIICQPAEVHSPVRIPDGVRFCGIDSGIRHAVGGSDYRTVRTAAFMAYSVIAHREGANRLDLLHARESRDWSKLPYQGFLANIPPSTFDQFYAPHLPDRISGSEFINRFGTTPDAITEVEPEAEYALLSCARHPVYENHRIRTFLHLLEEMHKSQDSERSLVLMGELMMQSHAGYSSIGLGNKHTDQIVDLVRKAGTDSHVFGARVSGGGSGGTVVVLCSGEKGFQTVQQIYRTSQNKYGQNLFFFSGNNAGSVSLKH